MYVHTSMINLSETRTDTSDVRLELTHGTVLCGGLDESVAGGVQETLRRLPAPENGQFLSGILGCMDFGWFYNGGFKVSFRMTLC